MDNKRGWLMKKLLFFFALILIMSCETVSLENPCAFNEVKERIRLSVSLYSWYTSNPPGASLELFGLALFDISEEKIKEWAQSKFGKTAKRVNIVEIGKPEKDGERLYRCSAIAEPYYTVEKVHSGKEEYYRTEIEEVFEVD